MLTQLVFEHSLRIRLKAESSNENDEESVTAVGTPDSISVAGTAVDSHLDERASQSSRASDSSDSQSSLKSVKGDKRYSSTLKSDIKPSKDKQNLIGKINNLVTTDLGNIVDGRDFLIMGTLQFFGWSLGLFSDTPTSCISPTSNNLVHHLFIRSTWMEVTVFLLRLRE